MDIDARGQKEYNKLNDYWNEWVNDEMDSIRRLRHGGAYG